MLAPEAVNVVGAHCELLATEIAGRSFTVNVTSFDVKAGGHVPETIQRNL